MSKCNDIIGLYRNESDSMSFASNVKSELLNIKAEKHCMLAELAGLLRVNGEVLISSNGLRIEFHTTNLAIARHTIKSIKNLYNIEVEIRSKKQMKLQKHDMFIVILTSKANTIINELGLMNHSEDITNDPILLKPCCKKAYLRGAFLASGSINSPRSSSYHLEIHTTLEETAQGIMELLNHFELNAKAIARKRGYISYIKESEKISDFLRLTGAINALFTYEDEHGYRKPK